ncbi:MAG: MCE family protein [Leptolyngbya sp. PLA3]|nr:MAG: MCE family protein [Cyanobacteria bacterium CYA]MCE7968801.1 MCE family protein [Leptolyngbya sp. PL-A3]
MNEQAAAPIVVTRPRRVSLAWIVPVLALATACVLGYQAWQERGLLVFITFEDAGGLRAGDALVYRGIPVGEIHDVRLSRDLGRVVIEARLRPEAEDLARDGTRFWVARPEVSLAGVSGLDTLLGPTYLNVLPGAAPGRVMTRFEGDNRAPLDQGVQGLRVVLRLVRRGTVSTGSPILYRDVPVGQVDGVRLAGDARFVEVDATVREEYAHLVRQKTRFFKATGIGVDFGWFQGLSVRAESLEALVNGAIAFATPEKSGEPVGDGAYFEVADQPESDWLKWDPVLSTPEP